MILVGLLTMSQQQLALSQQQLTMSRQLACHGSCECHGNCAADELTAAGGVFSAGDTTATYGADDDVVVMDGVMFRVAERC